MSFAIGDLLQERLPQLRAYARGLTRNRAAAEDLVQDTIERVLTSAERFDGSNFKGWSNSISQPLHRRLPRRSFPGRFHRGPAGGGNGP